MARKPSLHVVKPSSNPAHEPAKADQTMSVTEAAFTGSQLDLLKAMRARIARALDDPKTSPVALAALANRQLDIVREIEALEKSAEEEARERSEAIPDEPWDASKI